MCRRDSRSAGYTGGRVNIHAVQFSRDTGESIFQVRHGEIRKKISLMEGELRNHDPKKTWLVDDAIC